MPKNKPTTKKLRTKRARKSKKSKKMMMNKPSSIPKISGKTPPGVCYTKSGKIKKDRYSVWYGYHNMTKGGLKKSDFIKKGNKIISKKKHEQGLKAIKHLRK